jgi:hypothetical protein
VSTQRPAALVSRNLVELVSYVAQPPLLRAAKSRGLLTRAVTACSAVACHKLCEDPVVALAVSVLLLQLSEDRCAGRTLEFLSGKILALCRAGRVRELSRCSCTVYCVVLFIDICLFVCVSARACVWPRLCSCVASANVPLFGAGGMRALAGVLQLSVSQWSAVRSGSGASVAASAAKTTQESLSKLRRVLQMLVFDGDDVSQLTPLDVVLRVLMQLTQPHVCTEHHHTSLPLCCVVLCCVVLCCVVLCCVVLCRVVSCRAVPLRSDNVVPPLSPAEHPQQRCRGCRLTNAGT